LGLLFVLSCSTSVWVFFFSMIFMFSDSPLPFLNSRSHPWSSHSNSRRRTLSFPFLVAALFIWGGRYYKSKSINKRGPLFMPVFSKAWISHAVAQGAESLNAQSLHCADLLLLILIFFHCLDSHQFFTIVVQMWQGRLLSICSSFVGAESTVVKRERSWARLPDFDLVSFLTFRESLFLSLHLPLCSTGDWISILCLLSKFSTFELIPHPTSLLYVQISFLKKKKRW
jgi:hypothetical protein